MPKSSSVKTSKEKIDQALEVAYASEPLKLSMLDDERALWDSWLIRITIAQIERGILGPNLDVAADCALLTDELIRARRVRR